jgi:hypothetical protein
MTELDKAKAEFTRKLRRAGVRLGREAQHGLPRKVLRQEDVPPHLRRDLRGLQAAELTRIALEA